ncbi:G1/S-specific cyclin-D2-like [Frankliniella occidentalis]|uniref:G1/S-specific cyclin-D2-like n=1 Tax=Frankliniella occidentalis TaxID=133901 RepID=A0A6J1RWV5_FRAOC|nr:G1/S-specific cyclin-D2-like [Frankliniella occidentalis]
MDLLCCESGIETECRAYPDPALLNDDRVLLNMLGQEEKYTPTTAFFTCVQKDVTPQMRAIVSNWMLESWELLVLSKLKWDMSAVTPHDFFDHILRRLPVDTTAWDVGMIRRHTQTFIALCARGEHLCQP